MRCIKLLAAVLVIGARAGPAAGHAEAVKEAWQDIQKVPEPLRCDMRYLWIGDDRQLRRALCGHVNQLSTETRIAVPVQVGGLLRINLKDYGWKRETWEKLADADPYYHEQQKQLVTTEYWPGGRWTDGKDYPAGNYPLKTSKEKVVTVLSPVLSETPESRTAIAGLVSATQSGAPVLRGDWFLAQTAQQADKSPGYYDFLGVKNQKDFFSLARFDPKLAKGLELREAVSDSGVTQQPRAIDREATVLGGFWRTFDVRIAQGRNNPLRVLDRKDLKFDASEEFFALPNGMMGWGLFDKDGVRQDAAPDFIAGFQLSRTNDTRLHICKGCVACHTPNSGIMPIDGWARELFRPPLSLTAVDYEKQRELAAQYLRPMERWIERDRQVYSDAIKEATGYTPKEWANDFTLACREYDGNVDRARAARDLGVTEEQFMRALDAALKRGTLDIVLSNFLRPNPRSLGIRQWEELYPTAARTVRGLQ